ncbi:MAG: fimbria major subunit [Muribaculaceae bacterium]|nr:fimbria major subunit [Muribaculaceae bacterium]
MNYKVLLSSAALSMMVLAGCGNDSADIPGTEDEQGANYVNIAINLPTVTSNGRTNDNFDDGMASEYAVKSAYLVVFKSSDNNDEATATVAQVYDIYGQLLPWISNSDNNVTTTAKMVQKIQQAPADNLWVMVALNAGPGYAAKIAGKTYAELIADDQTFSIKPGNDGIFMSNAPLYKEGNAQTLVKLDRNHIYSTEAAAIAGTGVEVFVERGAAKVTLKTPANPELEINSKTYSITVEGWNLDVTNKSASTLRNVTGFADWKDFGTRFYSTETNRIYWGIDKNYTGAVDASAFGRATAADLTLKPVTAEDNYDAAYCYENTFDVANMRQDQTTSVVIKASFKPQGAVKAETFYTIGTSNTIYDKDGMQKMVIAQAVALFSDKNDGEKYSFAENTSVSSTGGDHNVAVGDVLYDGVALSADEIEAINNSLGTIHTYKDGICYYVARVKHFGESYTGWTSGDPTYGEVSNATEAAKKYLGRYGVLRNNWYELDVTAIKSLGTAQIPDPTPIPDDENAYYINFTVNIHSWAKRVQGVIL